MTLHFDHVSILSIRPCNNIVLSKDGKPINPHKTVWNKNKAASTPATPIAFAINQGAPASLDVQLSWEQKPEGANLLEALDDNGTSLFSGKIDGSGTVTVQAQASQKGVAQFHSRALHWQLNRDSEDKIELGTTMVEIFWVDLSNVPPSVYTKGVPVEILRSLSPETALTGMGRKPLDEEAADLHKNKVGNVPVATLVQGIFNYNPPAYDIWRGEPHFVTINNWNNITLHYNAYLAAHSIPTSILNCYDAAAVLQYGLRYNGYNTRYCYMSPFGYLKYTYLIGRGACNNPFYGSSGGPAYINPTDPRRTAFSNHAFVNLPAIGTVADACAGPHYGNENPQTYVNNATDNQYPNPPRVQRGTAANIGYYTGVTNVNTIQSIHELQGLPHTEAFKNKMSFSPEKVQGYTTASEAVAGKWPEPTDSPVLNDKWKTYYEEIVPGLEEVLKIWMLSNGEQTISMKLYVTSGDKNLAFNRFLSLGSLSQLPEPPYKAGPDGLGHYSAVSTQGGYSSCFWVFHNVVLNIISTDSSVDTLALSQWYYQWATRNLTEHLSEKLPLADIHYSSLQPKVGDLLHVSLISDENTMLDISEQAEGLRLISETGKGLVFDVLAASKYDLKVLLIDKDTLLVKSQTVKIDAKS